jgi:hypothetical protein
MQLGLDIRAPLAVQSLQSVVQPDALLSPKILFRTPEGLVQDKAYSHSSAYNAFYSRLAVSDDKCLAVKGFAWRSLGKIYFGIAQSV